MIKPETRVKGCVFGKAGGCGPLGKLMKAMGLREIFRSTLLPYIPPLEKAHTVIQMPETAQSGPMGKLIPFINQICKEQKITGMDLVKWLSSRFKDSGIEMPQARVGQLLRQMMAGHNNQTEADHAASEAALKTKLETQGFTEEQFELAARFVHELFLERNLRTNGSLIAPYYEATVAKHLEAQQIENKKQNITHLEIKAPRISEASRMLLKSISIAA